MAATLNPKPTTGLATCSTRHRWQAPADAIMRCEVLHPFAVSVQPLMTTTTDSHSITAAGAGGRAGRDDAQHHAPREVAHGRSSLWRLRAAPTAADRPRPERPGHGAAAQLQAAAAAAAAAWRNSCSAGGGRQRCRRRVEAAPAAAALRTKRQRCGDQRPPRRGIRRRGGRLCDRLC